MTADLDAALAAEEHRQGAPYLAEPGHCKSCANVDWAWERAAWIERMELLRATCEHGGFVKMHEFGKPHVDCLCNCCGAMWKEPL